jgi:hypothetical protein
MSSSKSVAAARARRAIEPPSNARPRTSIGSFSQVPPSFQPQPQLQRNPRMGQGQPQYQQPAQQMQQQQQQQPKPKISIGNAIALVSLRLGRLEQLLQENSNGSPISVLANGENNQINSEALTNIMNRLVLLENKPHIDKQTNDEVLSKLSRENKEIKDNLQMIVKTFNTFIKETNDKFLDYEAAFIDIENKLKEIIEGNHDEPFEGENNDDEDEISDEAEDNSVTLLSEDIKNEIRNISS